MSSVLDGLLPPDAAALYQRLLTAGRLRLADHPELADSAEMRELVDHGFARKRFVGDPALIPVEPFRAIENALLVAQRRILEQQKTLVRVRDQMAVLQRSYIAGGAESEEPAFSVQVLTDPAEVGALSVELCLSAEREFSNLETAHFRRPPDPRSAKVPPPEVVERGVRFRNIYARAVLDVPGAHHMMRACLDAGWELRVVPDLPMKLVLVDERAALLPLDPTGMEGAVLVRAPVILAMLRSYFDLLWARATPLAGERDHPKLSGVQDKVLHLMLSGMTDGAIARHLGTSERTVRRNVAALLELLGVDNRVAAAVVAVREGWID